MDWSRYAVGGAASRPDSFSGLDPEFQRRLWAFVQAAEQELGPGLQITSAYRSPEVQAQLYQNALKKYGSEKAARKWVAPPGKSRHNSGVAADFAKNGSLLRDANSREAKWIKENAARFGLAVPMSWEPWQVELAGARGGGGDLPPLDFEYDPVSTVQNGQNEQNALALPEEPQSPQITTNYLDPRAFMLPVQQRQRMRFT